MSVAEERQLARRWLAITLPWWPSDRARSRAAREAPPLLITREHHGAKQVVAVCPQAHTAGARPGMKLAQARALCGVEAMEIPWAPEADRRSLRRLASWCTRYGPRVMPIDDARGPFAIIVDVTGCEQVHGGEVTLTTRVLRDLHRRRIHAQVAIAPTQRAALVASVAWPCRVLDVDPREATRTLDSLPLWTLRLSPEILESLREVNVTRIGQALDLPRDGSADRFGPELWHAIDALRGDRMEDFTPIPHARPIEVSRCFDGATTRIDAVELAVVQLLDRFCAMLARRQRGVRLMELSLRRIDALPVVERLTLGRPSRHARHLWTLLRPRVERVNMGFGVEEVELRSLIDAPLHLEQQRWSVRDGAAAGAALSVRDGGRDSTGDALQQSGDDAQCVGEMLDQVRARLGHDAVRNAHDTDRFSGAWRPTVVFAQGLTAEVIAEDGARRAPCARCPVEVRWSGGGGRVIEHDGPERHSPKWWSDHRTAEDDLDCWRVRTVDGRWLWLLHRRPDRWSVIGVWA